MTRLFTPENWFWIVAGDDTRYYSSAAQGYVFSDSVVADDFRASGGVPTRISNAQELTDVLALYGIIGPIVGISAVRSEAQRRMIVLLGARDAAHLTLLISNGEREAIRLIRKGDANWSAGEQARAAELEQVDTAFEAIRAASNVLEIMDPIPKDFDDDIHWP
jgi:hypothetical protein